MPHAQFEAGAGQLGTSASSVRGYCRDSVIHTYPYGAITVGEQGETLAALEEMAPHVVAFSDDGKGVQDPEKMKQAMRRAKALGKLIVAHCEDESLIQGGYIHDGAYAKAHGHRGNPSASEWKQVERDLALVQETGCAYHVAMCPPRNRWS